MIRGLGARSALAVNVITMIGAGPLITIPLVVVALHGSVSVAAWVLGALIAICDGLVFAELASRFPGSGGTYVYLREAFGATRAGKLFAFLFVWQFIFWAPLTLASGYIGFAQYAAYLFPIFGTNQIAQRALAVGLGALTLVLLYRAIPSIARVAAGLSLVAVGTIVIIAFAGLTHPTVSLATIVPQSFSGVGWIALGSALIIILYDYSGYNEICALGDEVRDPVRTIPRAIVLSVSIVAVLYVALNLGVFSAVPVDLVEKSQSVASLVIERTWGAIPAMVVTVLILITAFASTYGLLLGSARIPYAAALDGNFLRPFAHLHPSGRFPDVSLVALGLIALPAAAFLTLDQVINALSAGIFLIQGIGQIAALVLLRRTAAPAPYRMWLFPIPALIALAGWVGLFSQTSPIGMGFGLLTLLLGALVFFVRAKRMRSWPFALVAALAFFVGANDSAKAADFTHSATVERHGTSTLLVDGQPFFIDGASFFYDRLPRSLWSSSLDALANLGINTIDLYVPWNWHELADGDFDFDGRTSPRRDLRTLVALLKKRAFKIILRPGPVIRNEWRNGGYPAWLLARPEYGMSQHDILEGRYPATATLQNANSDDAAGAWLQNTTHLSYTDRWIKIIFAQFAPVADKVIAVALDDDQGAYIDNQTWPAPRFHTYLETLAGDVHRVTGPEMPLFINTYEMKVTASSPVWAMGNWYQSDAYSIGEHDRTALEFSTGLLQTRPHQAVVMSEFQAGWLQQPEATRPRPADPSNTTLALHTLLGLGIHGVVNFPAQDSIAPAGWEAPFSNMLYDWDSALGIDPYVHHDRYAPTHAFANLIGVYGPVLATAHREADAAIAYLTSSYDERTLTQADVFAIAARTQDAQRACRNDGFVCDLVDLRFAELTTLQRYRHLIVPTIKRGPAVLPQIRTKLSQLQAGGTKIVSSVAEMSASKDRAVTGASGANALRDDRSHATFVDIPNYGPNPLVINDLSFRRFDGTRERVGPLQIAPRDAVLVAADLPLRSIDEHYAIGDRLVLTTCRVQREGSTIWFGNLPDCLVRLDVNGARAEYRVSAPRAVRVTPNGAQIEPQFQPNTLVDRDRSKPDPGVADLPIREDVHIPVDYPQHADAGEAIAYKADLLEDGAPLIVLENTNVRVVVSPNAGARGFVFQSLETNRSGFTSIGAMRDDVLIQQPPSLTDKIAKYTHSFPAGFFNRKYATAIIESGPRAVVRLVYNPPDVSPNGEHIERTLTLEPGANAFTVDERVTFGDDPGASEQRAIVISSLGLFGKLADMRTIARDVRPFEPATLSIDGDGVGVYNLVTHDLIAVTWTHGDIEKADASVGDGSLVARLRLTPGPVRHMTYRFETAASPEAAQAVVARGQGRRIGSANVPGVGEVAKWYTQSPQKRPSVSSCGFESHLPQGTFCR